MEESFMGRGNLLDPSAQEFYPQFALPYPQIYYPCPPPAVPPHPPLLPPPLPFIPSHYVHPTQAADGAFSSRAVVLSAVPPHATEPSLSQAMMAFGGVRSIDTRFLASDGIVTVHFYDLRSAQVAVAEIREQHVRQQSRLGQQLYGIPSPENWASLAARGRGLIEGQAVWAQFAAKGLDVLNQGLLFVTVSDPAAASSDAVRDIFQAFGALMDVRDSPSKPQHKFVEFFDVRDAARALNELNGMEVAGVRLVVEFCRPGGGPFASYNHQRQRSGNQNSPLPPTLARCNSQASSSGSRERGCDARISNVSKKINAKCNISSSKRNKASSSSRSYPSSSNPSSSKPQQHQGGKKGWKNYMKNQEKRSRGDSSSRFDFKGGGRDDGGSMSSSSSSCRDSRTTVMIKNIPNKYSQKLLLNMLDSHCLHCNEQIRDGDGEEPFSAFDFVYLPIDFNNKCNVGYGFVNLTSPEAAVRLYRTFHMQPWEVFNSRKICQVTYARLQGLEALTEHFKNSRFACANDEYLPVVFSPPRDGMQLTDPASIGGRSGSCELLLTQGAPVVVDVSGASSTTASTQAPSDHDDDGDGEGDDGSDETGNGISDQLAVLQL